MFVTYSVTVVGKIWLRNSLWSNFTSFSVGLYNRELRFRYRLYSSIHSLDVDAVFPTSYLRWQYIGSTRVSLVESERCRVVWLKNSIETSGVPLGPCDIPEVKKFVTRARLNDHYCNKVDVLRVKNMWNQRTTNATFSLWRGKRKHLKNRIVIPNSLTMMLQLRMILKTALKKAWCLFTLNIPITTENQCRSQSGNLVILCKFLCIYKL